MIHLLNNFPKNLRELAFDVKKERIEIKNHINHPEKDVQTVRLKFPLYPGEFIDYEVSENALLIVSSKDFVSIVEFAESSGDEFKIIYTKSGEPMVASLEKESSIKLQMVMATLREDTLKNVKQPVGATSYRELMESRLSAESVKSPVQNAPSMTDTEVQKVISPSVSTFQSAKNKDRNNGKNLNPAKRRSVEMNSDDELESEPMKKQRSDENNLSQKEQQEVSQVISALMLHDEEEDQPSPELFGSKGFRIIPKPNSTIVGTDSELDETSADNSQRLQKTVNRTELVPIPEHLKVANFNYYKTISSNSNEEYLESETTGNSTRRRIKESNKFAKKLFGAVLKKNSENREMGETWVRNSDSDESVLEADKDEPIQSRRLSLRSKRS